MIFDTKGFAHIESPIELEAEMFWYNCQTPEELKERLLEEKGINLIL